jgi:pimeloyl-ACP methyl ester carboxylesterase
MKHAGSTPPFRGSEGAVLPGSIAEIGYIRLGAVDQWVMIRGESVANPILILLHGGPGFPETRLFRHFNAALEKAFTVIYWDQRGTDKSFDRTIPTASMTIEQFLRDIDELVDRVRVRFGKDKVTIYGHSWGSALGVLYAARFPEKLAAYVGSGQVGDWPASELRSYAFTLAEAERRNDRRAVRQLRAIGAPPYSGKKLRIQRQWLARYVGVVRGMSLWRFFRIMLGGPEASILDLPNILRGVTFSECLWPEASSLNLMKTVPALDVPVFFFLGRHDHVIDAETSAAYFDVLSAPFKTLVWFEESAHEPPAEEPAKFHRMMVELVRPRASAMPAATR